MRALVAGLGGMGLPMARALVRAGIDTVGYDPVVRTTDVPAVNHPREAAADILVVVVRDAREIDALCFDAEALYASAPYPSLVMLCSTVSVQVVRALRERLPADVALVDAPMSGAPVAAEERRLSFMLGGDAVDIDALMPLVSAMGDKHYRLGPLGAGMRVKVLNNSVAAASVVAVRRALAAAKRDGIAGGTLLDVMRASSGATWFGDAFERISWAREGYSPDNTIGILVKDVRAGIESAGREPDAWDAALLEALIDMPAVASPSDPSVSSAPTVPSVPSVPSADVARRFDVATEGLERDDLRELVIAHREDLARHSPACSVHAFEPDAFTAPGVTLYAAREGGRLVGCGALALHTDADGTRWAELKTMRTVAADLRRGVAETVLETLLGHARSAGCTAVRLETGRGEAFAAATAFYARHGFRERGAFAGYPVDDPFSRYMELRL